MYCICTGPLISYKEFLYLMYKALVWYCIRIGTCWSIMKNFYVIVFSVIVFDLYVGAVSDSAVGLHKFGEGFVWSILYVIWRLLDRVPQPDGSIDKELRSPRVRSLLPHSCPPLCCQFYGLRSRTLHVLCKCTFFSI